MSICNALTRRPWRACYPRPSSVAARSFVPFPGDVQRPSPSARTWAAWKRFGPVWASMQSFFQAAPKPAIPGVPGGRQRRTRGLPRGSGRRGRVRCGGSGGEAHAKRLRGKLAHHRCRVTSVGARSWGTPGSSRSAGVGSKERRFNCWPKSSSIFQQQGSSSVGMGSKHGVCAESWV